MRGDVAVGACHSFSRQEPPLSVRGRSGRPTGVCVKGGAGDALPGSLHCSDALSDLSLNTGSSARPDLMGAHPANAGPLQLSSSLTSAPFVVATDRDKSAQGFNDDLRKFMEVMQHNWTRSIVSWRKEEMSSKAVYQVYAPRACVPPPAFLTIPFGCTLCPRS